MTLPVTRQEFYGTLFTNLGWGTLLIAAPFLSLYALATYPLVDSHDPFFLNVGIAALLISLAFLVRFRRRLFPWGHKLPVMQWLSILAMSILAGVFAPGLGLLANGALDRGPSTALLAKVSRKWLYQREHHLILTLPDGPSVTIDVLASATEYDRAFPGQAVKVQSKGGALMRPWIATFELPRAGHFRQDP